ncbi:MAG: T9SS type A sorting domain-containing protein [Flavobacteriia bacterium]|nr:T9SS type A sorting domain-containing protein [Flavobacteriia bacterium]
MKKIILTTLAFSFTLFGYNSLNAQITINIKNQTSDISGLTHSITNASGLDEIIDLVIHNNTGNQHTWKVTRWQYESTSPNVATEWSDYLCWGHETDATGGTCFGASQMNSNPWTSPSTTNVLVENGEAAALAVHINPHDVNHATTKYRYYIVDATNNDRVDSVDIMVSTNLSGVKEIKAVNKGINILPNPSDNFIHLTLGQGGEADLKITDVLGKVVYEGNMNTSEKIEVNSFKNGVYLATIQQKGSLFTKRFVVKH